MKLPAPEMALPPLSATRPAYAGRGVGILGTPVSSGNRGVLALGTSLLNLCAKASPGTELVLLLNHDRSQNAVFRVNGARRAIPVIPARLSPRSRPADHLLWIVCLSVLHRVLSVASVRRWIGRSTPWIRAVDESVLVGDVRGGDSFSDIYGMKRFLTGFFLAWSVILVKGSMVQFPQTYGPYKSSLARWLARYLLRRSAVIIARDKESQKVAQDLVGPAREVWLSPDVAFSLEAIVPDSIQLDPPLLPSESQLSAFSSQLLPRPIGLNINGLMYHGGYTRDNMFGLKLDYAEFLPKLVRALLAEHSGELWLVPHTYGPSESVESDPEACRRVRAALPHNLQTRVRFVTGEYDCHEIKGVIGQCGFFIGSRMHACIAALSQGIPCVGVAYSMKFRGVFESVGMPDWVVDGRSVTGEQAEARIMELYRRRDAARGAMAEAADQARARLGEVFRDLFARAGSIPQACGA